MRMRGLLCKVSCRFSYKSFETRFRKGRLYPAILREDGFWWLTNLEEKKRIMMNRKVVSPEIMKKYFKPYQPVKKKSKYERWKVG